MRYATVVPNHRILVVDDSREMHRRLCRIPGSSKKPSSRAKQARFEVDFALPEEAALEQLERSVVEDRPYGVAFVEMRTPPGSFALDSVRRYWQVDPTLQIVLYTESLDPFDSDLLAALSRKDQFLMLQKPFGRAELAGLAGAMCERWRQAGEIRLRLAALEQDIAVLHDRYRDLEIVGPTIDPPTSRPLSTPAPRAKMEIDDFASVVLEDGGSMSIRDISTSGIGVIVPTTSEKNLIDRETELTIQLADGTPIHVNGVVRHLANLNDLQSCAGFQFLNLGMENFIRIRDYVEQQLEH